MLSFYRPSSLAWEVRKSISPHKLYSAQSRFLGPSHPSPSTSALRSRSKEPDVQSECSSVRSLDFSSTEHKARESSKIESSGKEPSGGSWADRVKGVPVSPSIAPSASIAPQLSTKQENTVSVTILPVAPLDNNEREEAPETLVSSDDWEKVTIRHRSRQGNHVERGDGIQLSPVFVRKDNQMDLSSCEEDKNDQTPLSGNNQQARGAEKKFYQVFVCVCVCVYLRSHSLAGRRLESCCKGARWSETTRIGFLG